MGGKLRAKAIPAVHATFHDLAQCSSNPCSFHSGSAHAYCLPAASMHLLKLLVFCSCLCHNPVLVILSRCWKDTASKRLLLIDSLQQELQIARRKSTVFDC